MGWRPYLALLHPGPSVLCTAFTVVAGFSALAQGGPAPKPRRWRRRLLLAALAMLFAQTSTGVLNDAADVASDTRHQPYKPIPRGEITSARAWTIGLALGASSLAAAAVTGSRSLRVMTLGLASGWAYDLKLSRTPWSFAPFAVGLATVPRLGAVALGLRPRRQGTETALVASLSLALHLANAAPDVEKDLQAGRRSLPVLLGPARTMALSRVLLLGSAAVVAGLTPRRQRLIGWGGAGLGSLVVAGDMLRGGLGREGGRRPFVAPAIAGGCLAAGWLLGGIPTVPAGGTPEPASR